MTTGSASYMRESFEEGLYSGASASVRAKSLLGFD